MIVSMMHRVLRIFFAASKINTFIYYTAKIYNGAAEFYDSVFYI